MSQSQSGDNAEGSETAPDGSTLTDDELLTRLAVSNERKEEGSVHFRSGEWQQAISCYRSAIERLPMRPGIEPIVEEGVPQPAHSLASNTDEARDTVCEKPTSTDLITQQCAKARAVLNGNIGACFVKLSQHSETVKYCTEALEDDPTYVKVLQRRALSNEELNTWSSLSAAQKDYELLLTLPSSSGTSRSVLERKLSLLIPRVEVAQKAETAEMMGKLKELGNSFLGNFGLSTENFKFEPNGQGGYSMNFSQ